MKRKYSLLISGAFALVLAAAIGLSGQFELSADRSAKSETQKQQEALVEQTVEEKRQQLSDYEGLYNEQSIVLADTTKAVAEKLAKDLGARLRMTETEDYAVLYLPEGMTVADVYEDDAEVLDETAQKVLKLNRYSTIAWSARTNAAYATGNITAMMQYKERAISTAPYSLDEYLDYFDKLYGAMERYIAIGDQGSAAVCAQKLLTIPDQLNAVMEGSSVLAWHVQHIPQLTLPAEYQEKLEQIPGNLKGGVTNS